MHPAIVRAIFLGHRESDERLAALRALFFIGCHQKLMTTSSNGMLASLDHEYILQGGLFSTEWVFVTIRVQKSNRPEQLDGVCGHSKRAQDDFRSADSGCQPKPSRSLFAFAERVRKMDTKSTVNHLRTHHALGHPGPDSPLGPPQGVPHQPGWRPRPGHSAACASRRPRTASQYRCGE
jgi:hypothetical protein